MSRHAAARDGRAEVRRLGLLISEGVGALGELNADERMLLVSGEDLRLALHGDATPRTAAAVARLTAALDEEDH